MTVSDSTQPAGGTLAVQEKSKLRQMLRRFDLVLFTACAIVGLDSVAAVSQAGAQAVTWLVISLVVFLIPYEMLVAELGSAFPVEGGPLRSPCCGRERSTRCSGSHTRSSPAGACPGCSSSR
jgi:hypothetical protein